MRTLGQYIRHTRLTSNHTLFTASRALRIDKARLDNIENDKEYPTQTILKQMIKLFKMDETYVKIILKRILVMEKRRKDGTAN